MRNIVRCTSCTYLVSSDELLEMTPAIENPPDYFSQRGMVRYLSAPPGYGKTASILPAFLQSKATHYVYLAFSNNAGKRFTLEPYVPSSDQTAAESQAAAFMCQCIMNLFI
jgi:hypothetical protein